MSFACRRFRAGFAPGGDDPHRRECPACAAYAVALERAAGARLPLPGALRQRLLAIPAEAADVAAAPETPDPISAIPRIGPIPPQLPLPAELRARLLALPERSRPARPPAWVLTPRYAVAASYLAAVLLGAALGDPADLPAGLGRLLSRGVEQTLEMAELAGSASRDRLENLEDAAREAGRSVARSVDSLEKRLPARPSTQPAPSPDPKLEVHPENDAPRPRGRERRSP